MWRAHGAQQPASAHYCRRNPRRTYRYCVHGVLFRFIFIIYAFISVCFCFFFFAFFSCSTRHGEDVVHANTADRAVFTVQYTYVCMVMCIYTHIHAVFFVRFDDTAKPWTPVFQPRVFLVSDIATHSRIMTLLIVRPVGPVSVFPFRSFFVKPLYRIDDRRFF